MTRAPFRFASCSAKCPTPPAAPLMSTVVSASSAVECRRVVVDAGRLACEVRRGRGHVLGVCAAFEAGKTQKAEDLVAGGEAVDVRGDVLDDARHVCPRDNRQVERRFRLPGHRGQSAAQVPVRRIDADRVHADEHLARPRLGNRHLVVTQNLGSAVLMEPDRPHGVCRHRFLLPVLRIRLCGSVTHVSGPLVRIYGPLIRIFKRGRCGPTPGRTETTCS